MRGKNLQHEKNFNWKKCADLADDADLKSGNLLWNVLKSFVRRECEVPSQGLNTSRREAAAVEDAEIKVFNESMRAAMTMASA